MAGVRVLLVAALAGVLASSALGATGDPKQAHTLAGSLSARNALLKKSDFPSGWKSAVVLSKPATSSSLCKDTRPNLSDLTEIGYALAPDFSLGQLQNVTQWARVYRNAKQAQTAYSRSVTIGLVSCLAKQLKAASNTKATVSIVGQFRLDLPKVAQQVEGFRVVAHTNVKSEKEQFNVYADVMVIRQGPTVTTVTMTGFINPMDAGMEARLARTIAGRLGGKPTVA
jgi:hypothetical protein